MHQCERKKEGDCSGTNIEWHHALQVRGRQLQEEYALIALCTFHHRGNGKNDELARYIAYRYATDADLRKLKRYEALRQEKSFLTKKFRM